MSYVVNSSSPGWVQIKFEEKQTYEKFHEFVNNEGLSHICDKEDQVIHTASHSLMTSLLDFFLNDEG